MPTRSFDMTSMETPMSYTQSTNMPTRSFDMTSMETPMSYTQSTNMPINFDKEPMPNNLPQIKQKMNISVNPNEIAKNIKDLRNITPQEYENKIKIDVPIKFNIQGTSIIGKEIQKNSKTLAKGVVSRNINLGKNICK
jgi:hypothetical protein